MDAISSSLASDLETPPPPPPPQGGGGGVYPEGQAKTGVARTTTGMRLHRMVPGGKA